MAILKQYDYELPLKFLRMTRQGVLLERIDAFGRVAYGDIAPFPGLHQETLSQVRRQLYTIDASNLEESLAQDLYPSVRFGIEMLLYQFNTLVSDYWIPCCGLLWGTIEEMMLQFAAAYKKGMRTFKVKVGRNPPDTEIVLLRQLACDEGVVFRLDPNDSWTLEEAVAFCMQVRELPIEYVEDMDAEFFLRTGIPYAWDAKLKNLNPEDFFPEHGLKTLVLKPNVLGGVKNLFAWVRKGQACALELVISSAFESALGILHCAQLAGLVNSYAAAGLDPYSFLAEDVLLENLRIEEGKLYVPKTQPPIRKLPEQELALIDDTQAFTFKDWDCRAAGVLVELKKQGFKSGDRLAFYIPSSIALAVYLRACWHLGVVTVLLPLRIPFTEAMQLAQELCCKKVFIELEELPSSEEPLPEIEEDQECTILLTSGSTGKPKVVVHTYGNHVAAARASNTYIQFCPGDTWLVSLPMYHVSGLSLIFRALEGRGALYFSSEFVSKITHISVVPTQLRRMLKHQHLPKLKAILLGGAPAPPELIDPNLPIYPTYGMTEMGSQIATSLHRDTFYSVLPNRLVEIIEGEICVKGPSLFKGYLKEGALDPCRDAEGWFHTGDLGMLDPAGYLHVLGRKDRMFISGGENIYPEEIETLLESFDEIQEAYVHPKKDEEYGECPIAFVIWRNESLDPIEIERRLKEKLPSFKCPKEYHTVSSFS